MDTTNKTTITLESTVDAPVTKVWDYWTKPEHIQQWNNASENWHTPCSENDVRIGGKFLSRMEAKDGSAGFDFNGVYDAVQEHEYLAYTIGDGRKVQITFSGRGKATKVVEVFEAENTHSIEMQKGGWQAILDNFKKYTEAH